MSTSVVALLAAGASIVSSIQSLKETSEFARGVIMEVESIVACLRQLRLYLSGVIVPSRSRTSLVLIEQVQVVLTSCVTTFSELRRTLDKLTSRPRRVAERVKWTLKEESISKSLLRLQGSRISLNLMLTTLNCVTIEEAIESSNALQSLVMKTLESNEEIVRRLDSVHAGPAAPSMEAETCTIITRHSDDETVRNEALGNSHAGTVTDTKATVSSFAFDRDLQSTRVYGRIAQRESSLSLPSSTGRSRGWSFLSEVTLSDVSNISVISLPIAVAEFYYGDRHQYHHQDGRREGVRHQSPQPPLVVEVVEDVRISNIDPTEAKALWPHERVKEWMQRTNLNASTIEQFLGLELDGYDIAFGGGDDLTGVKLSSHQRMRLQEELQQLRTCLFDEMETLWHQRISAPNSEPIEDFSDANPTDIAIGGLLEFIGMRA